MGQRGGFPMLEFISSVVSVAWVCFVVAMGFGFIIFIHEFGHFIAAKWVGVMVEKFSIGFGKKIIGFKYGETEYVISLLPLGGYVKLKGEYPEEGEEEISPEKADPRSLLAQPVWARAVIFSAGVFMNFITAFPMITAYWMIGDTILPPSVGLVQSNSPADVAGLQYGDYILRVDGKLTRHGMNDILKGFKLNTDGKVQLEVKRGNERLDIDVASTWEDLGIQWSQNLVVQNIDPDSPAEAAGLEVGDKVLDLANVINQADTQNQQRYIIGVEANSDFWIVVQEDPFIVEMSTSISRVRPESPAEKAGLEKGDQLLSINATPLVTWSDLAAAVNATDGKEVMLTYERQGLVKKTRITPMLLPTAHPVEVPAETIQDDAEDKDGDFTLVLVEKEKAPGVFKQIKVPLSTTLERRLVLEKAPNEMSLLRGDRIVDIARKTINKHTKSGGSKELVYLQTKNQMIPLYLDVADGVSIRIERENEIHTIRFISRTIEHPILYSGLTTSLRKVFVQYGFTEAVAISVAEVGIILEDFSLLIKMLTSGQGKVVKESAAGPVKILYISYKFAEQGIAKLIWLLAILSVNLAIINLLPIPVLDGGHLFFLLLEKIKGSPFSLKTRAIAQWAGLIMILALVIYITSNDVISLSKLFQ